MTDEPMECQDCGAVLFYLTAQQAAQVAEHPENFILYCRDCWQDRAWEGMGADN